MRSIDLIALLFCALFLCSALLHLFTNVRLRSVREQVHSAMAKDAKQRQIHKAKLAALGIKSNALENRTGLSSPTSMSALETLSTLEQAKNKVDVFFNESSQFVDWLENHVLLSHDLARDYSSAAETVIKICIPISITTRGTKWKRLEEMLLLTSLLPSLVQTVEPGFHFGVYLGYDVGDPLLDAPGQIEELSKLVDGIVQSARFLLFAFCFLFFLFFWKVWFIFSHDCFALMQHFFEMLSV